MARTYFLLKTDNYIEELSVMYGILSVLTDNGIDARLSHHPSAFVLTSEEFDPNHLIVIPSENEVDFDCIATTKMTFQRDYMGVYKKMFGDDLTGETGYFSNPKNLSDMFRYLETQDDTYIQKTRHGYPDQNQTFYGSIYGVKGQRGTMKSATNNKIPAPIKFWSTLGFARATSALTINGNIELTWIPVPSRLGITEVVRYEAYPLRTDDDGRTYLPAYTRADSDQIGFAQQILKMQKWMHIGGMDKEFDGIVFAKSYPAGQRSINGNVEFFKVLPLSEKVVSFLSLMLDMRTTSFEIKKTIAMLITCRQDSDFTAFIHALATDKNGRMDRSYLKELCQMFNQHEIFTNEGIALYGKALRHMMFDSKGYDVQVALMSVNSPEELTAALTLLSMKYERMNKGRKPLSVAELGSVMALVQGDHKIAKNVADMILLHSTSYTVTLKKETEEKIEQLA